MRIIQRHLAILLLTLLFFAVITACGPADNQVQPTSTALPLNLTAEESVSISSTEAGYPAPESAEILEEGPYPGPAVDPTPLPSGYPAVEETFLEPRFRFAGPLAAGATLVEGQAPPNLSLALVDVTYNGAVLGSGISDANGRFSIGVIPLPDGNRIGITFSELEGDMTYAEMSEKYFPYRGEDFMNIPNVGIYFETTLVGP